jgi:serine/threonine protein kinase
VDIFSLGVIMYILLTSKFIFNAKDYNEILRKNKQCKVVFPAKLWDNLSEEAKDLCSKMLQKNPNNRITAEEALSHNWFKHFREEPMFQIAPSIDGENNIFNLNEKVTINDDLNTNAIEEDKEDSQHKDSVKLTDLMTSSPIMNKKKMLNNLKGINQEKEMKNTF